jgi:hypothetical protein
MARLAIAHVDHWIGSLQARRETTMHKFNIRNATFINLLTQVQA